MIGSEKNKGEMTVRILGESGYQSALMGLSLRKNVEPDEIEISLMNYAIRDDGHDKFLEQMVVWMDVNAPRYFWQQFDKIRVGVSSQSESTMHTIKRGALTQKNFNGGVNDLYLRFLNKLIEEGMLEEFKRHLPESFLQRRIITTNYRTLKLIVKTRGNDNMGEWKCFINCTLRGLSHAELITNGYKISGDC